MQSSNDSLVGQRLARLETAAAETAAVHEAMQAAHCRQVSQAHPDIMEASLVSASHDNGTCCHIWCSKQGLGLIEALPAMAGPAASRCDVIVLLSCFAAIVMPHTPSQADVFCATAGIGSFPRTPS